MEGKPPVRRARILFIALVAAAAGCSTATDYGKSQVDAQGNHPSGWAGSHPSSALPDAASCRPCHGDTLRGGISGVSCFSASFDGASCHANGPAFHPATWLDKEAGAAFHGTAYDCGVLVNGAACTGCHVPATPGYICLDCHFNEAGTQRVPTGSSYSHGTINGHEAIGDLDVPNDNSSVCVNCHDVNGRFGHMPRPLCHNCHAPAPPSYHPATWGDPDDHGAAAKAAPGPAAGFSRCQVCHGVNYNGGNAGVSCVDCHPVNAPHSPRPWRLDNASTRTHATTDEGNAAACFYCHAAGRLSPLPPPPPPQAGTPPGCFNNTLCHGEVVPPGTHLTGWLDSDDDPAFHGTAAAAGTINCATCHPISGHPTCTTCHFDAAGSRNTGSFDHANDPLGRHDGISFSTSQKTVCENCHETNRRYQTTVPARLSCSANPDAPNDPPGHPANEGCHYNNALLDPVFANTRY